MKKVLAALALTLLLVGNSFAAQKTGNINVSWDYPADLVDTIDGFKIYNQDAVIIADNLPKTARTYSGAYTYDDSVVQSFHIVSYKNDGQTSLPSNIKSVAPKFKPIKGVGTFTVEITQ